jgi:hypothetical protein
MDRRWMTAILLTGALSLSAGRARAQATGGTQSMSTASNTQTLQDQDIELLRKDIRSKKKQLIAANLTLTDAQATKFWPVYDQYTAELVKINNHKYALLKQYADTFGTVTDEQAVGLIKGALSVEEQVAQLRIRYVPIFLQVLPGKQTMNFFQLDRRIQSMIDLQLMSQIPLVQAQE